MGRGMIPWLLLTASISMGLPSLWAQGGFKGKDDMTLDELESQLSLDQSDLDLLPKLGVCTPGDDAYDEKQCAEGQASTRRQIQELEDRIAKVKQYCSRQDVPESEDQAFCERCKDKCGQDALGNWKPATKLGAGLGKPGQGCWCRETGTNAFKAPPCPRAECARLYGGLRKKGKKPRARARPDVKCGDADCYEERLRACLPSCDNLPSTGENSKQKCIRDSCPNMARGFCEGCKVLHSQDR